MAARIDVNPRKDGVCAAVVRGAVLAGIVAAVATCSYGERTYSADAIDSRVIDADTGEPLAGVNVVAEWVLKGGVESGEVTGYANVMETVTDKDGRFHFPAWGPVTVKRGSVREAGPALLLFKPGYHYAAYANGSSAEASTQMSSRWSGKPLRMRRDAPTTPRGRQEMQSVATELRVLREHGRLGAVVQFSCAVSKQNEDLEQHHAGVGIPHRDELSLYGLKCDSLEAR